MIDADQLRPRFGGTMEDDTEHQVQDLSFSSKDLKALKKELKESKELQKDLKKLTIKD